MPGLRWFNALPPHDTRRKLAACCATSRFVEAVAAGRPFRDGGALRAAADAALAELDWAGVTEALAAHPKIGERAAGDGREAAWSRAEQSAAATDNVAVQRRIADGNRAYQERFGHVFLVCAAGRGAEEILADLRARLRNDSATERRVVREELAKIVHLRLERLLA